MKNKNEYIIKIGYFVIGFGFIAMIIYSNIMVGSQNGAVTEDLLGFRVPQPPMWISYIPFIGGFVGWLYEFFSLSGLVRLAIVIIPAIIGSTIISVGKGTPKQQS